MDESSLNAAGGFKPVILIVDDDPGIRDALRMVISDQGYQCQTAANGADALRLLNDSGVLPNLIVIDLMMPVMNGWDLRMTQLADARLRAIPVVILTAAQHPLEPQPCKLDIRHMLRKPVDLDDLLEVFEQHLPQH